MKNTEFKINTKKRNLIIAMVIILVAAMTGIFVGCSAFNKTNTDSEVIVDATEPTETPEVEETVEPTDETVEPTETPEVDETDEVVDETVETDEVVENDETPEVTEPTETPEEPKEPAHTHKWSNATCTSPKTCECGETSGSKLNHNYVEGTCTNCGTKDPNYVPPHTHTWVNATCTSPKTCSGCGETSGSALNHNYVNGDCTNCGAHDPNYVPPHTHAWNTEEWTEQVPHEEIIDYIACNDCGATFTNFADLDAHQASTGGGDDWKHTGWHNDNQIVITYTTITHHRRVCGCGAVENID